MAKKTNEQIGQMIRDTVGEVALTDKETVDTVKIIFVVTVKNSETGSTYTKGGKGRTFVKYGQTDESITEDW